MPASLEGLVDQLLEDGWKEYKDQFRPHSNCFFKRFDSECVCRCNHEKKGIQVGVILTGFDERGWGCSLELAGELPDGTWIKLQNYSLGSPTDMGEVIRLIPRMIETWESVSKTKT